MGVLQKPVKRHLYTYRDAEQTPAKGEVIEFIPRDKIVIDGSDFTLPKKLVLTLDDEGKVPESFTLPVVGGFCYYEVHEKFPGRRPPYVIKVSAEDTEVDLINAVPVVPEIPGAAYLRSEDIGASVASQGQADDIEARIVELEQNPGSDDGPSSNHLIEARLSYGDGIETFDVALEAYVESGTVGIDDESGQASCELYPRESEEEEDQGINLFTVIYPSDFSSELTASFTAQFEDNTSNDGGFYLYTPAGAVLDGEGNNIYPRLVRALDGDGNRLFDDNNDPVFEGYERLYEDGEPVYYTDEIYDAEGALVETRPQPVYFDADGNEAQRVYADDALGNPLFDENNEPVYQSYSPLMTGEVAIPIEVVDGRYSFQMLPESGNTLIAIFGSEGSVQFTIPAFQSSRPGPTLTIDSGAELNQTKVYTDPEVEGIGLQMPPVAGFNLAVPRVFIADLVIGASFTSGNVKAYFQGSPNYSTELQPGNVGFGHTVGSMNPRPASTYLVPDSTGDSRLNGDSSTSFVLQLPNRSGLLAMASDVADARAAPAVLLNGYGYGGTLSGAVQITAYRGGHNLYYGTPTGNCTLYISGNSGSRAAVIDAYFGPNPHSFGIYGPQAEFTPGSLTTFSATGVTWVHVECPIGAKAQVTVKHLALGPGGFPDTSGPN